MAPKLKLNRQFWKKAITLLLSVAVIFLTPVVLMDYNIEATLLDPGPFKQIFTDQNIYQKVPNLVAGQIIQEMNAPDASASMPGFAQITQNAQQLLLNLDQEEMRSLVSMLLPEEWAKVKLDNILDQYFASMETKIYRPNLLVALTDIKTRLQGKIGLSFFVDLIRAQPPCNPAEKQAWQSAVLEEAPACFPSETILKDSESKTSGLLYQITARMPDNASLDYFFGAAGFSPGNPTVMASLQLSAARFWNSRALIRISPLFMIILLFTLGLFHAPGQPFYKLWAVPVMLAGAASLLTSVLLWPLTRLSFNIGIQPKIPDYISPALVDTGLSVAKAALARVTPLMTTQAILILILGALLYFGDRLTIRRLKKKKPPAKKYTLD